MNSVFDKVRTTISNGRPERKDVTARIQEQIRKQAEEDLKNQSLPREQRTIVYHPEY